MIPEIVTPFLSTDTNSNDQFTRPKSNANLLDNVAKHISSLETNSDLRACNASHSQDLIENALSELQYTMECGYHINLDDWNSKYSTAVKIHFKKFTSTQTIELYFFFKKANYIASWMENNEFFEKAKKIENWLHLSFKDFLVYIYSSDANYLSENEKQTAISTYISYHRTPFKVIMDYLLVDKLIILLPFIRYFDLRNVQMFQVSLIFKLVEQLNVKIIVLYLNNKEIKKIPPLPHCRMLYCSGCVSLQKIRELPICKKICV